MTEGEEQNRREALRSGVNLARLLLSVAAGTIVLSGTLLQTIYVGRSLGLLELAWLLLGVSLLFGYLLHTRSITQLDDSDLTVRGGRFELYSLIQFLAIGAGLVLFAIFVVDNVGAGPRLGITRADLGRHGRDVALTLDCRSGSDSGCQGEVALDLGRKRRVEIGHAVFGDGSDGPVVARVPLSRAAGRFLVAREPALIVHALASGRFGNETKAAATLKPLAAGRGWCAPRPACE